MLKMGSSGNCVKNGLEGTIADAQKLVKKQCSQSSRLECGQLVLRRRRKCRVSLSPPALEAARNTKTVRCKVLNG